MTQLTLKKISWEKHKAIFQNTQKDGNIRSLHNEELVLWSKRENIGGQLFFFLIDSCTCYSNDRGSNTLFGIQKGKCDRQTIKN